MLEAFVYWGLSLMVWEPEGGRSHATAFEVCLTLGGNKYVYQTFERAMCKGMGEEERESVGSPNGNQDFILRRLEDRARVDIGRYITRFNGLEIDESLFRINPARIHFTGVNIEQRIVALIPAGVCRSLRFVPVRLLSWCTRHDSQTTDLFCPQVTDGGLFGVNGILNDMALGFDDEVAGIGSMAEGRARWFVGRIGLSRRRRREEAMREAAAAKGSGGTEEEAGPC